MLGACISVSHSTTSDHNEHMYGAITLVDMIGMFYFSGLFSTT